MAVRSFNGVSGGSGDELIHTVGTSLDTMTFGCIAVIIKFDHTNLNNERTWFGLHNSGGTNRMQHYNQANHLNWWTESGSGSTSFTGVISDDTWYMLLLRKDSGTGAVWMSLYDYTADSWTHDDGGNFGNFLAAGSGGDIRMAYQTGNRHHGLIAVRGAWADDVAFALSASGNSDVEAAGLHTSLQAWIDAGVTSLWSYDQDAVTDDVDDLVGDAHQSSRTGTTVVTGDDPPGFTFTLGNTGSIAFIEEDDTAAAAGTVDNPGHEGTISWTEEDDTAAAAGTHTPPTFTGSIAWTSEDDDILAAGSVNNPGHNGSISISEADDTIAAAGTVDTTDVAVDITFTVGTTRVGSFAVDKTRVGSFAVGETVTQRGP